MALFKATVKMNKICNGERLEKGMSVEFASPNSSPMSSNGGKEVAEAFMRKYGLDVKKAGALTSTYLEVLRIN